MQGVVAATLIIPLDLQYEAEDFKNAEVNLKLSVFKALIRSWDL